MQGNPFEVLNSVLLSSTKGNYEQREDCIKNVVEKNIGHTLQLCMVKSHVPDVIHYIQNQEIHHRKETFLDEYRKMLKLFDVEYDEQYIFKELI